MNKLYGVGYEEAYATYANIPMCVVTVLRNNGFLILSSKQLSYDALCLFGLS